MENKHHRRRHHYDDYDSRRYERDYDSRRYERDRDNRHHDRDSQRHHHGDYDHHELYTRDHRYQDRYLHKQQPHDHASRNQTSHSPHYHSSHSRHNQDDDIEDAYSRHNLLGDPNARTYRHGGEQKYLQTSTDHRAHNSTAQVHSTRPSINTDHSSQSRNSSTSGTKERTRQPYGLRNLHNADRGPDGLYLEDGSEEEVLIVEERKPRPYSIADLPTFQRGPSHTVEQAHRGRDGTKPDVFTSNRAPALAERSQAARSPQQDSKYHRESSRQDEGRDMRTSVARNESDKVGSTDAPQKIPSNKTVGIKSALKQSGSTNTQNRHGEVGFEAQEIRPVDIHCGGCGRNCNCGADKKSFARKSVSFDLPSSSTSSSNRSETVGRQEQNSSNHSYKLPHEHQEPRGPATLYVCSTQEAGSSEHRESRQQQRSANPVDAGTPAERGYDPRSIVNNTNSAGGFSHIHIYNHNAPQNVYVSKMPCATTTRDIGTMTDQHDFHPFFRYSGC